MLKRFTLKHDQTSGGWVLTDQEGGVLTIFESKEEALSRGALEAAIGEAGTVRIHKEDGGFDEERTFPRSADPRRSPG